VTCLLQIYDGTGEFESDLFYIDTMAHGIKSSIGVLVYRNSGESVVFDSGMPNSANRILTSLKKLGIGHESIRHILLTHRHIDHAGSASFMLEYLPNALIGIHPFSVKQLAEPSKIYEGGKALFGEYATPMRPVRDSCMRALGDNEEIQVGEEVVRAIYTPGHTSDHIGYYVPSKKALFCGDVIGAFGTQVKRLWPACMYPSFDYQEYKTSMERIRSLDLAIMAFPHFGVATGRDVKDILDQSLAVHGALERIVIDNIGKLDGERLVQEIKMVLNEATTIFPESVRERAAEFMARGFIKGIGIQT
jgi:glyoxylase-like metal-dependent hydrolase (beta-lactamase superfamily II)